MKTRRTPSSRYAALHAYNIFQFTGPSTHLPPTYPLSISRPLHTLSSITPCRSPPKPLCPACLSLAPPRTTAANSPTRQHVRHVVACRFSPTATPTRLTPRPRTACRGVVLPTPSGFWTHSSRFSTGGKSISSSSAHSLRGSIYGPRFPGILGCAL